MHYLDFYNYELNYDYKSGSTKESVLDNKPTKRRSREMVEKRERDNLSARKILREHKHFKVTISSIQHMLLRKWDLNSG